MGSKSELETALKHFMQQQHIDGRFPSEEELLHAGRIDLLGAIARHGGQKALRNLFSEEHEGTTHDPAKPQTRPVTHQGKERPHRKYRVNLEDWMIPPLS